MASQVKGGSALHARFRAVKLAFKSYGRERWGPEVVRLEQQAVPVVTGKTRASFRIKRATQRLVVVIGRRGAPFINAGAKAHTEKARKKRFMRFEGGGTIFVRKSVTHPGMGARPFRDRAAHAALAKYPLRDELIDKWNRAA